MKNPLRERLSKLYGEGPRHRKESSGDLRPRLEKIHRPCSSPLPELLGGAWVGRQQSRTLVVDRDFEPGYSHGNLRLGEVLDVEASEVAVLAGKGDFGDFSAHKALFVDTETTGLSGGTGTCAFLVGIGYFREGKFRVRQLFLPGYEHEQALLRLLGELVEETQAAHLVTFNGKCYDLNLLGYRFILQRVEHCLERLHHLDLLHPSRILWRNCFQNCTLQTLERKLLGLRRSRDIPSSRIPQLYFNYLHTGSCRGFKRIFAHNRLDILTLVGLLVRSAEMSHRPDPRWFVDPRRASRLHQLRGNHDVAVRILEQSLAQSPQPRPALLAELGFLKKRLGEREEALRLFQEAIELWSRPPVSVLVEAAKILEHDLADFSAALSLAQRAQDQEPSQELEHRCHRLQKRLAGEPWYSRGE